MATPTAGLDRSHLEARLLIVDDQRMIVDVVEAMLRKAGYREIETLTDSSEAIAAFERFRPDLVLLDLHMPGMDGFEVLAGLRDRGLAVPLPVLMLTADAAVVSQDVV